jgi:hypothetical protein
VTTEQRPVDENIEHYWIVKKQISDALAQSNSELSKAVLSTSDRFFYIFSQRWVRQFGREAVYRSVFCQLSSQIPEVNYCLKISPGDAYISVLTLGPTQLYSRSGMYFIANIISNDQAVSQCLPKWERVLQLYKEEER